MASIAEIITELRGTLQHLTDSADNIGAAEAAWAEANTSYATVFLGSWQPEEQTLSSLSEEVTQATEKAKSLISQSVDTIEAVIKHYEGSPPTGEGSPPEPLPDTPKPYQNPHGDNYPPEAAGIAAMLPKRVVHGQKPQPGEPKQRTVAVVRVNGRVIPGISSGGGSEQHDEVVAGAANLLRKQGYREKQVEFLKKHAEMKALAILCQRGVQSAEIVINNTPCGVEQFQEYEAVCHKVLTDVATRTGMTLTVYGTYQDNRPYKHVYGRRTA